MPPLFHTIGYVSVALWALVPVLWVIHFARRPRGWLVHVSLLLAIAAFFCAKINSDSYVNRLQIDQSAELAAAREKQEAARQAALEAREGDVAEVRFAEDSAIDRFDAGGMDESERKYYEKLQEDAAPAWQREKKQRGQSGPDDSLESLVGANEDVGGGMDTETIEKEQAPAPIIVSEARYNLAQKLDAANLKTIRGLLWLAVILLIFDYLARFNRFEEAYLPLPIPAGWPRAITPLPTIIEQPQQQRQPLPEFLSRLVRRGDSFLLLSNAPDAQLPTNLHRLPGKKAAVDVLRANDPEAPIDDDFTFESLWHNRSCFVVDDETRATALFDRMIALLNERKQTRASVRNPVHVVWNLSTPPTDAQQRRFYRAARNTGFSLIINPASERPA